MSREEVCVPEDRKLSAVKSWFTRSVSFGGLNGSTTAMSMAAAAKGLSEGNGRNGVADQEPWGGLNVNLKQLSMRRTKASNENERETVPGSPSMVPRNVTPLTPLTPLRWKSNARYEEDPEETKSLKTKETVQEPKAVEQRSRLGLTVTNAKEHLPAQDVSEHEQDAEDVDGQVDNGVPKAESGEDDEGAATVSSSGQDMKASSGDDVMTMTIDFLRARLLSERSASKAAKQQIQELGMKMMELELKLEQEVEEKKKAEKTAEEALLKLLTGNFSRVADCTARATQSIQHANPGSGSGGEEIKEELLQRAESSVSDFSRTDSVGSSLGSKDFGDSKRKSSSQLARNDANGHSDPSPKKKDNRTAIENRLQKMWSQISADMHALAEDGSQGELAQEQLINWMERVPAVLHNRACPQKLVLEEMQFNSAIEQNGGQQKKAIYHQGRPYGAAPTSRSAEDAFRNAQHDNGGAHAMWDDRDGVGQAPTDSYYRQRERNEPHEKKHRHGHRRSHSADSSNWPAEEDYKLVDMPNQQRLSGEIYPGRTTQNGMTGHQRDNFLKTNGSAPAPLSPPEPKLFLGYGPAFDAPSDHVSLPPYQQGRVSNNSVTDVLLALRKAKASIQKSGSAPFMDPYRVKSEYGVDSQTQYISPPLPEHLNHTRSVEHDMGAARIRPSNSSLSLNYNPPAMDLRPGANGHSNYVDQLNVGHGIEFFL